MHATLCRTRLTSPAAFAALIFDAKFPSTGKAAADTTASVQPPAPKAPAKPRFRKPATRGPYKAFSTLTSNDQKAARRREIRYGGTCDRPGTRQLRVANMCNIMHNADFA